MINYSMLKLPIPFEAPVVNAYLINHDPITLIDCGTNSPDCIHGLKEQLATLGLKISDIKRILVSHAHSDHFGSAAAIQRISQCQVFMTPFEMSRAGDYKAYVHQLDSYNRYAGMPEPIYRELVDYHKWENSFVEAPEGIVAVEDGHVFPFDGFELEVVFTPGHSNGHICFYKRDEGLLFSGDTLMEGVIPNPSLEFSQDGNRQQSLIQYMNSVNRLKSLEIKHVMPGHGISFTDTDSCYKRISSQHQKRKEKVSKIAANLMDFSPFDVAVQMFRDITAPVNCLIAINEVIGILDILEVDGTVMRKETEKRLVYSYEAI